MVESVLERRDQIFCTLHSHRHPDESVSDAHLQSVLTSHVSVCEHCRAGDDRLCCPQVLTQRPGAGDRVHQLSSCCSATLDLKPQHPSVHSLQMLLQCQLPLGEGGKTWVGHLVDLRVLLQHLRDLQGRLRLLLHSQGESLDSRQSVEGVLGSHDVPQNVSVEFDGLVQLGSGRNHSATNGQVVTVVEFGGRLDDHICPQFEWLSHQGSGECGIAHVDQAVLLRQGGDGRNIGKEECGVAGGL
mmetsp:Transcript_19851/g.39923  ORF Transcript_19851/g.39923 Transcript_19851/m.39923 type:complete len:243 (-) Transcript_19851:681-1409(-)